MLDERLQPQVWWVNQGVTNYQAREVACLWAPLATYSGKRQWHWDNVNQVRKGDIIVHAARGHVVALGRAVSTAYPADPPYRLRTLPWRRKSGRRVDVEYFELSPSVPIEHVAQAILDLNIRNGPINKNRQRKQVYLCPFSRDGLDIIRAASPTSWPRSLTPANMR